MKRLFEIMVSLGLVAGAVSAQETVIIDFRNYIPGVLDAPVFDMDGTTPLEGGSFTAGLFWGPAGTAEAGLIRVAGSLCSFQTGTNAGYWQSKEVALPSVALVGDRIEVQVRVWESVQVFPFPEMGVSGKSRVLSLVVTNSLVPLVGLDRFGLQPEWLSVERQQDQVVVRWIHQGASAYELQTTDTLTSSNSWGTLFTSTGMAGLGTALWVTNPIAGSQRYYRLKRWR